MKDLVKDLKIKKTTDYKNFKKIKGNREVNRTHVIRLAESIDSHNLLPVQPIMVNEAGYIIDGQHRLAACEMLEIPAYYVEVKDLNLTDIQRLNANIRPWSIEDFVESYCKLGKNEYIKLREFSQKHDISNVLSAQLLRGTQIQAGGTNYSAKEEQAREIKKDVIRLIRNGNFKITDPEYAEKMAARIKDIQPYTEKGVWRTRSFMAALQVMYDKGVSHERFMKQLDRWHSSRNRKIERQLNRRSFLLVLDQVLNFQQKKPTSLI